MPKANIRPIGENSPNLVTLHQCGQIGRIFAYWVIVTLGSFLKITEVAQILGCLFRS
jgi:hypothetical protein